MKQQHFYAFFISLVFILLFVGACKKPCKEVDCGHGTCNEADGTCNCEPGWNKDSDGKCSLIYGCYNKDCGHGTCNEADGTCNCEPGWRKDLDGKCSLTDGCYNKDCGHGTCIPTDSSCLCDLGWLKDYTGKCTKPDLCYNKDCGHGTCQSNDGSCKCFDGYENDSTGRCSHESREKFYGTWDVVEQRPSGTLSYKVEISPANISNYIFYVHLNNFAKLEADGVYIGIVGVVSEAHFSVLETSFVSNNKSYKIHNEEAGIYANNSFTLKYTLTVDGVSEYCVATYTKVL